MARRTFIHKRRLRASLERELAAEASRMLPSLSREIAQSVLPLAVSRTQEYAGTVYRNASERAAPPHSNAAPVQSRREAAGMSLDVDINTKSITDSSEAVDRLGASFESVIVKGGKLDEMLRTTAGGFGKLITASDSDAAQQAFGALLKDIGTQAISGVQAMLLAAEAQSAVKGVLSFGATLAVDAPLIAAAYVALEGAKAYINSLDRGGVLLGDQLIMAHDRETVIPFEKAPAFFAEAVNRGAGSHDTFRKAYTPSEPTSTAARVRVSFGDMRGALRQAEIRSGRRSI